MPGVKSQLSKAQYVRKLIESIPQGESFTTSDIADLAFVQNKRYMINARSIKSFIIAMPDVVPIAQAKGGMVYVRRGTEE